MDLLYHFFIISAIISRKVSELNSKTIISKYLFTLENNNSEDYAELGTITLQPYMFHIISIGIKWLSGKPLALKLTDATVENLTYAEAESDTGYVSLEYSTALSINNANQLKMKVWMKNTVSADTHKWANVLVQSFPQ